MNRTVTVFLLMLAAALCAAAPAAARPVPLPPGAAWTIVHDAGAVSTETAGTMAYAYADVENARIVTTGPLDRREVAHEVGHIFDWKALTDTDRAWLTHIMGAPTDRTWWQSRGGAEWFADYYAAIATDVDPRPHRTRRGGLTSGDGGAPYATLTYRRLQRVRWFLLGITIRDGLQTGVVR